MFTQDAWQVGQFLFFLGRIEYPKLKHNERDEDHYHFKKVFSLEMRNCLTTIENQYARAQLHIVTYCAFFIFL